MQQLGDVLVRVDAVTICGTDLHILRGDVPEVTAGRILGHEAVEPGGSGWVLGHTIDWAQAEFVRVPFADTSLHPLPDGNDESALSLADMIPPPARSACSMATSDRGTPGASSGPVPSSSQR